MQTKREYLAGLTPPLAIAGARGRLSRAAHEAIAEAEKNGMKFKDSDSVRKVDSDSNKKNSERKPKANSVSFAFGDTPAPIWNTARWYVEHDGKRIPVDGKEVCRRCGYSLNWQACREPLFPIGIEMLVVRR